jgi:hypothetical protein
MPLAALSPISILLWTDRMGVRTPVDLHKDEVVLHTVEIRRPLADMTRMMSAIREWLDDQRFEPDAFRSTTKGESVVFRLDYKVESEAKACAEMFAGRLIS